jgi:hypothetical protein
VMAKVGHWAGYRICWRISGASSFPRLNQKNVQARRRQSMASSV